MFIYKNYPNIELVTIVSEISWDDDDPDMIWSVGRRTDSFPGLYNGIGELLQAFIACRITFCVFYFFLEIPSILHIDWILLMWMVRL
jgi:hypothetical protein